MFRKIKLIAKLLLLQLTAKSQSTPFEQIPFTNPLTTDIDSILHEQVKTFFKKAKAPGLIIGISQNGEKKFYNYVLLILPISSNLMPTLFLKSVQSLKLLPPISYSNLTNKKY